MIPADFLQIVAVILEIAVTVISIVIAARQKKPYGWCIAVTFGLFVFFDIVRIFAVPVPDTARALIFLAACASMVYGVWLMYRAP